MKGIDMNRVFSVGQTYSETTPESVEHGDFSDNGWEVERNNETSLVELLDMVRDQGVEHIQYSTNSIDIYGNWYTTDYRTGEQKQTAVHVRASRRVINRIGQILSAKYKH